MLPLDGGLDIFGDLNEPRTLHPGPVAGQPDKIDLDGHMEVPNQV
jgi:hypothetical protein